MNAVTGQVGLLTKKYCGKELPLTVIRSPGSGRFFIGTWDSDEGQSSRESQEYFSTRGKAEQALATNAWTQRMDA